ncbi:endolytic transglycosylase MltG [Niabella terrae]
MQKTKIIKGILVAVILAALFIVFKCLGPATKKTADGFYYVNTGTGTAALKQQMVRDGLLGSLTWFNLLERFLPLKKPRPGKYAIPAGTSVLRLLRMLRNGSQTPVNLVITRIRTREQLAGRLGRSFEFDSIAALQFLNSNDSLRPYGLDSNTVMGAVLPLTYKINWATRPKAVFDKFYDAYQLFWTAERRHQAEKNGLTINEVITLASIIDEETNARQEKGQIASVYLNRIRKGMPLQADPTVKFALNDFAIKRVLKKHLQVISPYNTYMQKGLPPGPINTPQEHTIDAVLNAPETDYLYFVASPAFDGTHIFTTNYQDHLKYAKDYQQALNDRFGNPAPASK